ncbi:MAG TPA: DUF1553 domain-containing protein [Dongiaceae bacterium]|nr:DUF1553 domain-containing protein [Dongiaceae bacterium]
MSGNLDPAPGGEFPFAPEMSWKYTQHQPFLGKEQDFATNKRSVYLMQQRIRRQPFLDLFDGSDPNAVTGVRPVTTTALQALYTMNDPFFHAQADGLAVRVGMAYGSDLERLTYAFRLLYSRAPSAEDVRDCRQFFDTGARVSGRHRCARRSQEPRGAGRADARAAEQQRIRDLGINLWHVTSAAAGWTPKRSATPSSP